MPKAAEKKRKTVDVWVTRDPLDGDDSDKIFVHLQKPRLIHRMWVPQWDCLAVPKLKPGQCKRLRLMRKEEN